MKPLPAAGPRPCVKICWPGAPAPWTGSALRRGGGSTGTAAPGPAVSCVSASRSAGPGKRKAPAGWRWTPSRSAAARWRLAPPGGSTRRTSAPTGRNSGGWKTAASMARSGSCRIGRRACRLPGAGGGRRPWRRVPQPPRRGLAATTKAPRALHPFTAVPPVR